MTDVLLQLVWVATHHGLRKRSVRRIKSGINRTTASAYDQRYWSHVHSISSALGHPPAPGGPL